MTIAPLLALASERSSPSACVISVTGELDRATVPSLRETVRNAMDDGIGELVLDLSRVDFVDGAALGLFLKTSETMRVRGGRFGIVCTTRHLLKILRLVDVDGRLRIFASRDAALAGAAL
jgi:anti-sigma B factor antagonist